jgi:hypothetical protein
MTACPDGWSAHHRAIWHKQIDDLELRILKLLPRPISDPEQPESRPVISDEQPDQLGGS